MNTVLRQGDVLLIPTKAVDTKTAKQEKPRQGRLILAEGEATGHHHSIDAAVCQLFSLANGSRALVVAEPTTLTHQEHGTIEVAPGLYFVVGQREYTPQEIRRVRD